MFSRLSSLLSPRKSARTINYARQRRSNLFLETLEDRCTPAGGVTAVFDAGSGTWTITGDAFENDIRILQIDSDSYRLVAEDGDTTVAGAGTGATLDGVVNIVINMGTAITGNDPDFTDEVYFDGDGDNGTSLQGFLTVTADANLQVETISTHDFNVAGQLLIDNAAGNGDLDVDLADDSSWGSIIIFTGDGDTDIEFGDDGDPTNDDNRMSVATFVSINDGLGGDDQDQHFHFYNATIGTWFSVVSGDDDDHVLFDGDTNVGQNIAVLLNGSADDVDGNRLEFDDDNIDIGFAPFGNPEFGGTLPTSVFYFGSGLFDEIDIDGGIYAGGISINTADSAEVDVEIDDSDTRINGFLSVVTGAGEDDVNIEDALNIAGNVTIDLGTGEDDDIEIADGADIGGNLLVFAGGTNTQIHIGAFGGGTTEIGGFVSINAENATDTEVEIGDSTNVTIRSFLSVVTGDGQDEVDIGNDNVRVHENMSIIMNGGNDNLYIDSLGGGFGSPGVQGFTNIDLGDGDDFADIDSSGNGAIEFQGGFLLLAGDGDDLVEFESGVDFGVAGLADGGDENTPVVGDRYDDDTGGANISFINFEVEIP